MIIDSHLHVCEPPCQRSRWSVPLADGSEATLPLPEGADLSVDRLLRDMDALHIEKAVANAFPGMLSNQFLSQLVKAHPDRLIGFAWVDDPKAAGAVQELDRAVGELGLRGLKLHPLVQRFSPADPDIVPLIQRAAELRVPVFIHMRPLPQWGDFQLCAPEHLVSLWRRVPQARVLIGHMGMPRWLDLLPIAPLPGLYVETSHGLVAMAELFGLEFATRFVRSIGVDKVVFGSDWMGGAGRMSAPLDTIQAMALTQEEKDKILGGNIQRVLEIA